MRKLARMSLCALRMKCRLRFRRVGNGYAGEHLDIYLLKPNDILFAGTGGTVGKSYLVKVFPEDAIYAGYLIRTNQNIILVSDLANSVFN